MNEYTNQCMRKKVLEHLGEVVSDCQAIIDYLKTGIDIPYDVHINTVILTLHLCRDISKYVHFDIRKE